MNKQDKLNLLRMRYSKLIESPKNIKCPGTVKKLRRQIRAMEK